MAMRAVSDLRAYFEDTGKVKVGLDSYGRSLDCFPGVKAGLRGTSFHALECHCFWILACCTGLSSHVACVLWTLASTCRAASAPQSTSSLLATPSLQTGPQWVLGLALMCSYSQEVHSSC